jgi:small subunit ribosomal protein S16
MALKIRLRRQGRRNRPFYRLVVTEVTSRRDGAYVEALGWYDPLSNAEQNFEFKSDRIQHWLDNGAQLTESVEALMARGAPAVLKAHREKIAAHQVKQRVQRRAKASA